MPLFKKIKQPSGLCSLQMVPGGIAFSYISNRSDVSVNVDICDYYSCNDDRQTAKCLQNIVARNNLQGTQCNLVLHSKQYRLLHIDAPKVSVSEYKSAVRWQIKNMIDYSLEDLAVDVILPPQDLSESNKKIYVVAVRKSELQRSVDMLYAAQLQPFAIDVPELALRNLLTYIMDVGETTAFLYIAAKSSILLLLKDSEIYFARHMAMGSDVVLRYDKWNLLIEEVRKSIEYCCSQLKQVLTRRIILSPLLHDHPDLVASIGNELATDAEVLKLGDRISAADLLDNDKFCRCYVSIGGALRREEL